MSKKCKQCNAEFEISQKDIDLYNKVSPEFTSEKFDLPIPERCNECREMERLAFRNEKILYNSNCKKCSKNMISVYSNDKNYNVYCPSCWWSDDNDNTKNGIDFDFSRSFFEQIDELFKKSNLVSLLGINNENSDYVNQESDDKDCYMNAGGHYNFNCHYNTYSIKGEDNIDNYWVVNCRYCYECIECSDCYEVSNSIYCNNCSNIYFCMNCIGCKDCFGCSNLRNKKYCIYNKEVGKEYFESFINKFKSLSYKDRDIFSNKVKEFVESIPRKFAKIISSEECTGDSISNSKNIDNSYLADDSNDCSNLYIAFGVRDSIDMTSYGWGEKNTGCVSSAYLNSSINNVSDMNCDNIMYSLFCFNSSNLFGCVGLKKKQYCIFNKQYTKEQYEELVPKIIKHMINKGEWGKFFPINISPFCFNETVSYDYYTLTKEQALKIGAKWKDDESISQYSGDFYIPNDDISIYDPNQNKDADVEIKKCLQGVHKCEVTGKPFKLISQELLFYIKHSIPIPRRHPEQRHRERIQKRNPRRLYDRKCMKSGCNNEFKTTFDPNKKDIVYCEKCYNEFLE